MFGDDLDPTVTTARVRFKGVSDARAGSTGWQERLGGHGQEGSENPIGLGMVNESKGGTRQLRTSASFMKTCRCNAHEAMR